MGAAISVAALDRRYAPQLPALVTPYFPTLGDSIATPVANDAHACRVIVPRAGTLRDLAIYISTSSGNLDLGVFTTEGTRNALYRTGSVASPGTGWRIIGDPQIAVDAGDQLDFVVAWDNALARYKSHDAHTSQQQLPAGFWPAEGALAKLSWLRAASFPLPASFAEGVCAVDFRVPLIIARVA